MFKVIQFNLNSFKNGICLQNNMAGKKTIVSVFSRCVNTAWACMYLWVKLHRIKLVFIPREWICENDRKFSTHTHTRTHTSYDAFGTFEQLGANNAMGKNRTGSVQRASYHRHLHTPLRIFAYAKFKVITLQTRTNCKIKHKTDSSPHRHHDAYYITYGIWHSAFWTNQIFRFFEHTCAISTGLQL